MNLTLSEMPPPLSDCYRNFAFKTKKGKLTSSRANTKRYDNWISGAMVDLIEQKGLSLIHTGPVIVTYMVKRPDKRRRDLDNLLKALNDVLVKAAVIGDDSDIHDLRIVWATPEQKFAVEVTVQVM